MRGEKLKLNRLCKCCEYETNECKNKADGREGGGWGADLPSPNYEGSAVIVTCYSWLSVLIGYYNQQYIIITIIHVIPEEHLFSVKFTITSMFGCAEKGRAGNRSGNCAQVH